MASADFCMFSAVFLVWPRLLFSERPMQTSPGTTRFFPSISLPHLSRMIPCSYWASACMAVLPSYETLYVVSVRQARGLPARVNRFPLTSGFLQIPPRDGHPCLRLYPSRYRADSGLSPIRNVRRRAHHKNTAIRRSGPQRFIYSCHFFGPAPFRSSSSSRLSA